MNKHGGYAGIADVTDYSVNINPIGLPESIRHKLIASIDGLISYPDISGEKARKALAHKLHLEPNNLIMGNGASELIYLFARAIQPKKVLIVQPTFNEYERAFRLIGSKIITYQLSGKDNFDLHIENFHKAIAENRPDVVVICNPCNPTAKYMPVDILVQCLELIKRYDSYLFIDESFIEFTGHSSIIHHVDYSKLFSIRSMTKYYAVPGLRIGYGVASEHIVQKLETYKEPWTMNSLALSAVPAMIYDSTFHEQVNLWLTSEHQWMYQALCTIEHLDVYRSNTNFFLCKLYSISGDELNSKLEPLGAHVRVCDDFTGLDGNYIRIALRRHEENSKLICLLDKILSV